MPGEPRALTSEVLTEEAKDQVIDDKSRNADKDPEVSEAAVHESEAGAELPVYRGGDLRGLCENSVGKPDAGNRHVRFDERGRETGRIGTAPFLDSTFRASAAPLNRERRPSGCRSSRGCRRCYNFPLDILPKRPYAQLECLPKAKRRRSTCCKARSTC